MILEEKIQKEIAAAMAMKVTMRKRMMTMMIMMKMNIPVKSGANVGKVQIMVIVIGKMMMRIPIRNLNRILKIVRNMVSLTKNARANMRKIMKSCQAHARGCKAYFF
jgi:hypothetical protein